MGADAKAYLWFGTKPRNYEDCDDASDKVIKLPIPGIDDDDDDARDELDKKLESDGIKLVDIPVDGDGKYALGILASYRHHDWDFDSVRFEMYQPTEEDKGKLFAYAVAMGWPVELEEIGWYLDATFF